jgi:hypothetical protein
MGCGHGVVVEDLAVGGFSAGSGGVPGGEALFSADGAVGGDEVDVVEGGAAGGD